MAERIGLLGGTFDPVHLGHLRGAEEAVEFLGLDRFVFIPAALPPHKPDRKISSFEDRFEMLRLAVADYSRFEVSDIERRLPGKSYTVITLRELRKVYPRESELFFLVGLDAFAELETWYQFRELFALASIVVLRRPGCEPEEVGAFLRRAISPQYSFDRGWDAFRHPSLRPVHCLRNTPLDISSSHIRRLAAEGRSIRYLVPHEIMRYITANQLYRRESTSHPDNTRERKVHAERAT